MTLLFEIPAAFLLDLAFGDPQWLPHPVRWIGRLAAALENPLRKIARNERVAGLLAALIVVGISGAVTALLVFTARRVHPLLGSAVSILILYTTFAARDLARHARAVLRELEAGDLKAARGKVSLIVGRDTATLDAAQVSRAAVESVAENTVDGVTAPLFFAALLGPVGAMMYKASSTLDSLFGYKNERYLKFGWAPARFDDLLNYVPARVTA